MRASIWRIGITAGLGGLLFGFDTAVIAGTTDAITQVFHLTPAQLGFTVTSALLGTIPGAAFAAIPSNWFGRRTSLRLLGLIYILSALGCALAWNWPLFLIFRIIGGIGIGGCSVVAPMYIAEVSPAEYRGRMVGMFQLNVVLGILLAYVSNFAISMMHFGPLEWRWKFGIAALPAALFSTMLLSIPESPRWLLSKGRTDEARSCLQQIGSSNPEQEFARIQFALRSEANTTQERLWDRHLRKPVFLAVSIAAFNQLSGINAILYYLNDIFAAAGFSKLSGNIQAVIVGVTNLLFTLIAMNYIDRFGRRFLLLVGSVGTTLALGATALIFQTSQHATWLLWMLILFIASFAFSQGAVVWVYISEIFPTSVRAAGQSLGSLTHWVLNAAITLLFPLVAVHSHAIPFYFFALMMALQFFLVLTIFPETRARNLESIESDYFHA
ncbi:MAG: sugar porter family MFS transporter [Acidobacteriaceae bacterium]|nr:sugar porter family MFS transporter [Acidobacteriaceae bacterium]